jgi:hypothetical protein
VCVQAERQDQLPKRQGQAVALGLDIRLNGTSKRGMEALWKYKMLPEQHLRQAHQSPILQRTEEQYLMRALSQVAEPM